MAKHIFYKKCLVINLALITCMCMLCGCPKLGERIYLYQSCWQATLIPITSYKTPEHNNEFQRDYCSASKIIEDFAKKNGFVDHSSEFEIPFSGYYGNSTIHSSLTFYYYEKDDAIIVSLTGDVEPNKKLKEIAPELHDKLVSEFGNRIKWQENK